MILKFRVLTFLEETLVGEGDKVTTDHFFILWVIGMQIWEGAIYQIWKSPFVSKQTIRSRSKMKPLLPMICAESVLSENCRKSLLGVSVLSVSISWVVLSAQRNRPSCTMVLTGVGHGGERSYCGEGYDSLCIFSPRKHRLRYYIYYQCRISHM